MIIEEIVQRRIPPEPWSEGDKIPWHEPEFSERMLREHLSQEHDLASRRLSVIDAHVDWIHNRLLQGKPARVLDLGCGPGFYTSRLAGMGHSCTGIDFSPASIRHARQQAGAEQSSCTYVQEDLRRADFGTGFDLVMFVFGELNVFRPAEAEAILRKAGTALAPGGVLLLEVHRFGAVEEAGKQTPFWNAAEGGLFAATPHVWLQESFWDATAQAAVMRYFVIDVGGAVRRMTQTIQAYTDDDYQRMLERSGFASVEILPSFRPSEDQNRDNLMLIVARKDAGAQP